MELVATEEDCYLLSDVSGFLEKDSRNSSISAYGMIHDASGCGRYLLKVQTDTWNFFVLRRDIFINIVQSIVLITFSLRIMASSNSGEKISKEILKHSVTQDNEKTSVLVCA